MACCCQQLACNGCLLPHPSFVRVSFTQSGVVSAGPLGRIANFSGTYILPSNAQCSYSATFTKPVGGVGGCPDTSLTFEVGFALSNSTGPWRALFLLQCNQLGGFVNDNPTNMRWGNCWTLIRQRPNTVANCASNSFSVEAADIFDYGYNPNRTVAPGQPGCGPVGYPEYNVYECLGPCDGWGWRGRSTDPLIDAINGIPITTPGTYSPCGTVTWDLPP